MNSTINSDLRPVCTSCCELPWACRCIFPLINSQMRDSNSFCVVGLVFSCNCIPSQNAWFPYHLPAGFRIIKISPLNTCSESGCKGRANLVCPEGKLCTQHAVEAIFRACSIEAIRAISRKQDIDRLRFRFSAIQMQQ